MKFGSVTLPLQDHFKILGVTFDAELRFDKHIHHIAHQASLRVSALHRVAGFLDKRGLMTLYKAQVRPHLEYGALTWMSSAATHLQRLDKVERRVQRLIKNNSCPPPSQDIPALDTLEHRRDVAALGVLHKAQVQEVQHLAGLRLPPREAVRDTRTVFSIQEQVGVPRSHTSQHQRTFTARTSRMWNEFTAAAPSMQDLSIQQVKVAAHRWRGTLPTPMRHI
ncbi:hypothetical protein Pcinc_006453 [Petrolisthes cinctipes]|uniref:Uncharacterized protein n=1 Tax=Petrolisthes cinctipes TaxID=88211 RepID=A0AAE1GAL2_PETCI|nr:hypothetical protein Pcinc_006453 [Petrolisthes cinctipes]